MKIKILFLICGFIFLSCHSKEKSIPENKEKSTSRILNQELKEILPALIQIQNQTFDNERINRNYDKDHLYARFLTTENFIYLNLTFNDCGYNEYYSFTEFINQKMIEFRVDSISYQPERFFDLKNLKINLAVGPDICEDWYFVAAKFKLIDNKLTLIKISTFFDNDYANDFYDKSDSVFLNQNEFMLIEPEPDHR
jgi:hypothetical protein